MEDIANTLKGAALYLTSTTQSSARSFSERRADLLSGKRPGSTALQQETVDSIVAANDVEEQLALEAAEAEAARIQASNSLAASASAERAASASALRSLATTAVTTAVGPDVPLDLSEYKAAATTALPPAPAARLADPLVRPMPREPPPTIIHDEPPFTHGSGGGGSSALDRMAAFLAEVPFDDAPSRPSALNASSSLSAQQPLPGGDLAGCGSRVFASTAASEMEEEAVERMQQPPPPPPPPLLPEQASPPPHSPMVEKSGSLTASPKRPQMGSLFGGSSVMDPEEVFEPPPPEPQPQIPYQPPPPPQARPQPPPAKKATFAAAVDDGLPAAIDDWLEDLDSDVEELPSLSLESLSPAPPRRPPLDVS